MRSYSSPECVGAIRESPLHRLLVGSPLYAILAACAILAGCGPAVVLDDIPRDRTLILMNGGPNQYSLFDNQNPYIPGSDQGFHMGTLPAVFEPLIMYNVLTGEYENWLAESWAVQRQLYRAHREDPRGH